LQELVEVIRVQKHQHRITIPKEVCEKARIKSGDKFIVFLTEDGILLKKVG